MIPLISVVIPCHNYSDYLPDAIKSALAQTYSNLEVIVVDDESDDFRAAEIARDHAVRYIRIKHKGKATPAHTHNEGLKVVKGAFVSFLSADDKMHPDYVQACYDKYMCQCFCDLQSKHHSTSYNEQTILEAPSRVGFVWTGCQEFGARNLLRLPYRNVLRHTWSAYGNPGGQLGAMLVPTRVYRIVGGYDITLSGREDWDWAIRCLRERFIGVAVKEPLLFVRVHSWNLTARTENDLFKRYPWIHVFNLPIRVKRNVRAVLQKFQT